METQTDAKKGESRGAGPGPGAPAPAPVPQDELPGLEDNSLEALMRTLKNQIDTSDFLESNPATGPSFAEIAAGAEPQVTGDGGAKGKE
jgi:hypothetical protein